MIFLTKLLISKTKLKIKNAFSRHYKMSFKVVKFTVVLYALIGLGAVALVNKNEGEIFFRSLTQGETIILNNTSQGEDLASTNKADRKESGGVDKRVATVTAYTSRVAETDASPYITANGTNLKDVFHCVVAANGYDFGTKLEIESLGVCEVVDRMNSKYGKDHLDIYMGNDVKRALEFGKRKLKYEVVE